MMGVELSVERVAGETEELRENLPLCRRFGHHMPYMASPGLEPGTPLWKTGN
jgi:hypothetical protein